MKTKKPPNWKKIEREYISGTKPAELCKKYNLNRNTFSAQRIKGKWTDKKAKSDQNVIEKIENIEADIITAEKKEFHETASNIRKQLQKLIEKSNNTNDIANLSRAIKSLQDVSFRSLGIADKIEHSGKFIIENDPDADPNTENW